MRQRVGARPPIAQGRDHLRTNRNASESMGATDEDERETILTLPGSLRYRTASTPGRLPDDVPNVADSLGIPTEPTKDLGSTIFLGQMSQNPRTSVVGYLRIGVGTEMVAGSSVFRDFPASQERFENEWRPREPCSFARRCKGRVELPGPSGLGHRRRLRDRPSLRRNNKHLKPGYLSTARRNVAASKAALTQVPLPDRRRIRTVHVYRVRLLHELSPGAGAKLISRGSKRAEQHTSWGQTSCVPPSGT